MKGANYFQIAFLVVGTLAVLEFIFLRGMFTWLIAVTAVIVGVIWNMQYRMKIKRN